MHACNCVGAAPGERLCPCMKNQQATQEAEWRREHERKLDSIPAVAPDNDPEDTIARFARENYPNWNDPALKDEQFFLSAAQFPVRPIREWPRVTVEDQITESDARASKDLQIFFLGVLTGCCWAGLVALVVL